MLYAGTSIIISFDPVKACKYCAAAMFVCVDYIQTCTPANGSHLLPSELVASQVNEGLPPPTEY